MPFTSIRRLTGMIALAVLTSGVAITIYSGASHAYASAPDAATPDAAAPADAATAASPAMDPAKNALDNLSGSQDYSTFVAALKATGVDATLTGPGPIIVFAPTNTAFAQIPKDKLDDLMKPENKAKLTAILNYHIVPGRITAHDLNEISKYGIKVPMKTVQGDTFGITKISDDVFSISDESGGNGNITKNDLKQSNGMIFAIDIVLMPKQ